MASSSDDSLGWVLFGLLALWVGYDKWWKEDEIPRPVYTAPARPVGLIHVTTSKDGIVYSVDADSVRGEQAKRSGWVVMDHAKDREHPQRTSKEMYLANCEDMSYTNPSFVAYTKDGDVAFDWDESEADKAKTQHAIPDSIGESILETICLRSLDPAPERKGPA